MKTLTVERLKEVLNYDPETGDFFWLKRISNCIKVGDKAGCLNENNYLIIRIDTVKHYAHRLVWFYMTGKLPSHFIDHISGNVTDNRFHNLREASDLINCENKHIPRKCSKTGLLGATKPTKGTRFISQIGVKGKNIYLGSYRTAEEAHESYINAKRELHEGCTI